MRLFKRSSAKHKPTVARPAVVQAAAARKALWLRRSVALSALLGMLLVIVFGAQQLFFIQRFSCTVVAANCPADVVSTLQRLVGQSLFNQNFTTVGNELLTDTPYRVAGWTIELPGQLHLDLIQDPALYTLVSSDTRVFVSTTGTVTAAPEDTTTQLLSITFAEPLTSVLNEKGQIKPDLHQAFSELSSARTQQRLEIQEVLWQNDTVTVSLPELRLLLPVASVSQELERARLVLDSPEFKEHAASGQELDVRFRMPVLRKLQ